MVVLSWLTLFLIHIRFAWTLILPTERYYSFLPRRCPNRPRYNLLLHATANDNTSVTNYSRNTVSIESSEPLTNLLLKISYDGTHFHGWSAANDNATNATQPLVAINTWSRKKRTQTLYPPGFVRSVQGELQRCLAKLYGNLNRSQIVVEGCSRTDKGVHSRGMVALVYGLTQTDTNIAQQANIMGKKLPHPKNLTDATHFLPLRMPPATLVLKLNRMLPNDIRVTDVAPTPGTLFHPTLSAVSKTYHYTISVGSRADPTQRRFVWHVGSEWNVTTVANELLPPLCGTHNFSAFQGAPRSQSDKLKRQTQNTNCTIHGIQIERQSTWITTETYRITIMGDRFLYKMIRFLVGSMVAVGQGDLNADQVQYMLNSGDRRWNFQCAPPHGLVLDHIDYGLDNAISWQRADS